MVEGKPEIKQVDREIAAGVVMWTDTTGAQMIIAGHYDNSREVMIAAYSRIESERRG